MHNRTTFFVHYFLFESILKTFFIFLTRQSLFHYQSIQYQITCFTECSLISTSTCTVEFIDIVITCSTIPTWIRITLINFYQDNSPKLHIIRAHKSYYSNRTTFFVQLILIRIHLQTFLHFSHLTQLKLHNQSNIKSPVSQSVPSYPPAHVQLNSLI